MWGVLFYLQYSNLCLARYSFMIKWHLFFLISHELMQRLKQQSDANFVAGQLFALPKGLLTNNISLLTCFVSPPPAPPDGQYEDGQNTNQNQMKNACLVFIVFQVLKVLLMKILKMQPPIFYFLLFLLPFTLAQSFLQIFKTSFNIQLYIANSTDPVNIAPVEEK